MTVLPLRSTREGAGGRLNVAPLSDPDDLVSLDEEGGVLDRRFVAVGDQTGAREQRRFAPRPIAGQRLTG